MSSRRLVASKVVVILASVIVLAGLLAWAPWLAKNEAERLAIEGFLAEWQYVPDGCGLNCRGCGLKGSQRTLFGYAVTIEYACGLLPADTLEYHRMAVVHVNLLGQVRGLPRS